MKVPHPLLLQMILPVLGNKTLNVRGTKDKQLYNTKLLLHNNLLKVLHIVNILQFMTQSHSSKGNHRVGEEA